jgi:hypothetical protein
MIFCELVKILRVGKNFASCCILQVTLSEAALGKTEGRLTKPYDYHYHFLFTELLLTTFVFTEILLTLYLHEYLSKSLD